MGSQPTSQTVVLITGANQGIGFETSKKLAAEHEGYHIIMAGRRKEAIDEAAAALQKQGLSVEALVMDVTSDTSISQAAAEVDAKFGHIDVLINNAGIAIADVDVKDRSAWAKIFDTNLFGAAAVTDAFLPLLEKSKTTKRIVFLSSSLSSMNRKLDPNSPQHSANTYRVYSCSKSALNMLAGHYAVQHEKDSSWKINAVCPGYVATNLNDFHGYGEVSTGAIQPCRMATLGPDGPTGTFTEREGTVAW